MSMVKVAANRERDLFPWALISSGQLCTKPDPAHPGHSSCPLLPLPPGSAPVRTLCLLRCHAPADKHLLTQGKAVLWRTGSLLAWTTSTLHGPPTGSRLRPAAGGWRTGSLLAWTTSTLHGPPTGRSGRGQVAESPPAVQANAAQDKPAFLVLGRANSHTLYPQPCFHYALHPPSSPRVILLRTNGFQPYSGLNAQ